MAPPNTFVPGKSRPRRSASKSIDAISAECTQSARPVLLLNRCSKKAAYGCAATSRIEAKEPGQALSRISHWAIESTSNVLGLPIFPQRCSGKMMKRPPY